MDEFRNSNSEFYRPPKKEKNKMLIDSDVLDKIEKKEKISLWVRFKNQMKKFFIWIRE